MQVGAGRVRRRLAQAALLAGVLTGCAGAADGDAKTSTSASASADAERASDTAVRSAGSIGAAGSACELPVTFDIAEDWKAEAIDTGTGDGSAEPESELAQEVADALLHQGPVTAACEVDAKPAGNIGFLRVWTGEEGGDDARAVLEDFVAAEKGASKAKYSAFAAGGLKGVEVKYLYTSKLLEETKEEAALAVATKQGPVVIHLGGMDTDEHRAMLPAYELAKRTLRAG
ncbi:lipoprotein [Streptomyces sp. NPDC098781]|uniref:lipoprotein n=1 Tax=Streptomyces sp. NPDC098781 TaxID=3366097 RepID=UPI0038278949